MYHALLHNKLCLFFPETWGIVVYIALGFSTQCRLISVAIHFVQHNLFPCGNALPWGRFLFPYYTMHQCVLWVHCLGNNRCVDLHGIDRDPIIHKSAKHPSILECVLVCKTSKMADQSGNVQPHSLCPFRIRVVEQMCPHAVALATVLHCVPSVTANLSLTLYCLDPLERFAADAMLRCVRFKLV